MTTISTTDIDNSYYDGNITPYSLPTGSTQLPNSTVYDNCYYNGDSIPVYTEPTIVDNASISEPTPTNTPPI